MREFTLNKDKRLDHHLLKTFLVFIFITPMNVSVISKNLNIGHCQTEELYLKKNTHGIMTVTIISKTLFSKSNFIIMEL